MAVKNVGEKYRCNICGNEVTVTKAGGGTLVCCGEDMEKINQANSNNLRFSADIPVMKGCMQTFTTNYGKWQQGHVSIKLAGKHGLLRLIEGGNTNGGRKEEEHRPSSS